jgi:hypothetical protein
MAMKPTARQFWSAVVLCLVHVWLLGQTQQKTEDSYNVIHIDGDRVYINAGTDQGAYVGMVVTLHEPIKWQDKKGTIIEDNIPVAFAILKHVGRQFSIFTTDSATLRFLQKGSIVRFVQTGPRPPAESLK